MIKIKTLTAALAISLAGMSTAQACTGTLTTVNESGSQIEVKSLWTQNKKGNDWMINFSTRPDVAPHSSQETKLVTTRLKTTSFRVRAKLWDNTTYESNYAKCSDGWTITLR